MGNEMYLTSEGANRLRAELEQLKGPARQELAKRFRSAISMGDLSENADYHAAKEAQSFLEGRIQELEHLLKYAVIVEDTPAERDQVTLGCRVTIQQDDDHPETFQLVGVKEADPINKRISYESPFGVALLGARVGDEVRIQSPQGEIRVTILAIE